MTSYAWLFKLVDLESASQCCKMVDQELSWKVNVVLIIRICKGMKMLHIEKYMPRSGSMSEACCYCCD